MERCILIGFILLYGTSLIGISKGNCSLGIWGDQCSYECPVNCYNGSNCTSNGGICGCVKETGDCYSCPKLYYGDRCQILCGDNCSLSDQCLLSKQGCGCNKLSGHCNNCPKNLWGDFCERSCSDHCVNSECTRTHGNCSLGCTKGFYGTTCNVPCQSTCQYGCDQLSGQCLPSFCANCLGGLPKCDQSNEKCVNGCVDGFYGDSCDQSCRDVTGVNLCAKCTHLNILGAYVCLECQSGYYYDAISSPPPHLCKLCSLGCKINSTTVVASCFPDSGTCRFGCLAGWGGSMCDTFTCSVSNCNSCVSNKPTECSSCQDGWYLESGQCIQCSDYCSTSNVCDRTSGSCQNGCKNGWYGNKCIDSCTTNCLQGECNNTGVCLKGCNGKRYGQKCDLLCTNCLTACNRSNGLCDSTCIDGYHGQDCNQPCHPNCLNNKCNKNDGKCSIGCKSGYYGVTCENACRSTCSGNICNFTTGACSGTCTDGNYGNYCDLQCPNNCVPRVCQKVGGACTSSCKNGYHGTHCNIPCPTTCSPYQCLKSNGSCSAACPSGKYGNACELSCSSTCNGTSCGRKSGECLDGCKVGFYGGTCQQSCTSCDSLGCFQISGECIGSTVKDESEVDIVVIIGATFAAVIALMIIILIICCHCYRVRNKRKGGSADILTPRSDSLDGIDNRQFATFDELKKDDWVLRSSTARYEDIKQNGVLITRLEADAPMDYYNIPPPPPADYDTALHVQSCNDPAPPEPHLNLNIDGRNGIQVEMLPQYIEYMLHRHNAFEEEYNGLPQGLQHPHDAALKPGNKLKNRYKNIYAYDHSRVKLVPELESSDDESSAIMKYGSTDYINASFFDGYHDPKAYISSQGPTDEMVDDFWRMIWQLRIQSIVMLTNVVESGQIKCKKYWPDENRTEKFGNFYVRFDYQEIFADFILTNLVVTKSILHDDNVLETRGDETDQESSDNARLSVKHFQFTSWPDKDVPQYVTPLVEYYFKVKSMHRDGPLLVHCSAGVGRSGTFIGLDYLMDQADQEGLVNIYKCVEKMRIARPNMVQTPDQYVFLHQALSEALLTSESPVDEEEFENYFNQMQLTDAQSGLTRLQNEFNQLKSQKVKHKYEAANTKENEHRNRRKDILASDECRVFLWSKIKGCTDYVNAIYLPSFRNKYCFIATEMPQCSTIIDICRMIFQEEVRTIVMLDNETSGIQATEHYWPNTNQTMECGPFSIKVTEEKHDREYTVRSLSFKFHVDDQKGTYKVNQFHYKGWSEGKVTPKSVDSFLTFVRAVTDWQSDSVKHPIIVHCLDGATKVGLFCLVRACCDRLQSDGEVSVIHTLHHMRARRQQLVPNFEQYKFCHECILQQINLMDT